MGKALRYRLFKTGRMPEPLSRLATSEGVLVAEEGLSSKMTVKKLRLARASVNQGTKLVIGSVVATPERLLMAVGAQVIVDAEADRADPEANGQLTLTEEGALLAFEVADLPKGSGERSGSVELELRFSAPPELLAAWPDTRRVNVQRADAALLNGWQGMHSR